MNKYASILICAICSILLVSCPTTIKEEVIITPTKTQTLDWQKDSESFIQFYTNESKYSGLSGNTLWNWGTVKNNPITYVETELKKISGDKNYGYGIIFCVQDTGVDYLSVVIDIEGNYQVIREVNNVTSILKKWALSTNLKKGYNVINKIKAEYKGNKKFSIYFNDVLETDVMDNISPELTGGYFGYAVGISNMENFPDVPVDVRFKQLYPVEPTTDI